MSSDFIKTLDIPEIDGIYPNQSFFFSGFLFYVDGWSWDNVPKPSNLDYSEVSNSMRDTISIASSDPYQAIEILKQESAPIGEFSVEDSYRFPELYFIAATCRRFQVTSTWREKYTDIISPEFLETYSLDVPTRSPIQEGEFTTNIWAGNIQSFTNSPDGRLDIGSYIFAKKLDLQRFTPVSIENSSRNLKIDRGFGEIDSASITNYYNPIESFSDELLSIKNGWYGVVSLDSTPYIIRPGRGINFDIFIKVESDRVTRFHESYPTNNISIYGKQKKQYLDV